MEFAIINGRREVPTPRCRGTCPVCGEPVLAKCGSKIVWHWSHGSNRHCDPWWENETVWHRDWKACFPEAQREVVHFDVTGEKHVADVQTARGMIIEFQNSPMPPDELRGRERFYGKMIWIVNGASFKDRFHILDSLPDPRSEFARDLVFDRQTVESLGSGFWRKSENPAWSGPNDLVRAHRMREIETEIAKNYRGHHRFDWQRPRDVWYAATVPVFFDFGGPTLCRLLPYDDRGLRCVRRVGKRDLVAKNGGTYAA